MNKQVLFVSLLLIISFQSVKGAGYSGYLSDFSISGNGGCSYLSVSFRNLYINITSKTTATLRFQVRVSSSGAYSEKELIGSISNYGSSIDISFPTFYMYQAYCYYSNIPIKLTFQGSSFGNSYISGYMSGSAASYYTSYGYSSYSSVYYYSGETAGLSVSGLSDNAICSNKDLKIQAYGDNYQSVSIYIDNVKIGSTIETDNSFSINRGLIVSTMDNLSSLYGLSNSDGSYHTIQLEINGERRTYANFTLYRPISGVNLTASNTVSCNGNPINFSVTPKSNAYNYEWSTGISGSGLYNYTALNPSTNDYFVTIYSSNRACATKSNVIKITSFPKLNPTINAEKSISCKGDPIRINVSPNDPSNYDYNWSNGSNASSILVYDNSNYQVTVTPKNGCPAVASNIISNLSFDEPITNYTVSPFPLANICNQDLGVKLNVTKENNVYLQWSTGENSSTITARSPGNYTVYLSRGACNIAKTIQVTQELLSVSAFSDNGTSTIKLCSGQNYNPYYLKSSSNNSQAKIKWKRNSNSTDAPGTNNTSNYLPTQEGYYFAIAEFDGCISPESNRIKVELINNFGVNINPANPPIICDGEFQSFFASPNYAAERPISIVWNFENQNISKEWKFETNKEGVYQASISYDACKANSTVNFVTKPSKMTLSVLDNTKLVASQTYDGFYQWYFKNPPYSDDLSLFTKLDNNSTELFAPKVGIYAVKGNRNGCGISTSPIISISLITALETNESSKKWNIFPNPSVGKFTSDLKGLSFNNPIDIQILDEKGNIIQSIQQNNIEQFYQLDHLSNGTYYLLLKTEEQFLAKKIIIMK